MENNNFNESEKGFLEQTNIYPQAFSRFLKNISRIEFKIFDEFDIGIFITFHVV